MKKRWQKSVVLVLVILSMLGTALIGFGAEAETTDEYVIYVSPDGDDSGDGSPDNMLKTPEGAQNFLRESGVLGKKPIRVIFKDGNYYISKGLVFGEQDAGTKENPVVWQSETKGGAHFYGSTVLDGSKFTAVTDEDILARIPVEARDKVLQMDLTEQGITVEACPPYLWAGSKFTQPYTDLIVNGKEQMLARYPNGTNNYDQWEKVIDTFTTGSGKKGLEYGGTIKYSKPRLARWTTAKHAWIAGHTGYTYAIERVAVSSVDPEKGYIVCDESSVYAFRDASPRELQIFNLIEELDCATEWYIDWDTNILYYLPPNEIDDNTVLELITLNDDMLTFQQGIDLYMTIKDFELSKTRKRLAVLSGNNVTLDGCTLTYSKGTTAVYLSGDNVQVKNNVIAFHDGNAVRIYGGGTMIKKTTRTHSKVENNYMYEVGRHNVTGGHAMSQEGACVDIMHNTAHYVEHGTYSAGWEARDTRLMYNEFYNFGRNLSDVGAYYMRYSGSALGNEVAYNYFYDYGPVNKNLGSAIQGIYYDEGYSHGNAHHNTMINGSGYGVQLGGGKSNKIESNIMVNMGNGPIVSDARGETWANGAGMGNKTIPETQSQLKYTPWFGRVYPHLNHAGEAAGWHAPYGNVIRNNISDKEFNFNARVAEL
ncbi:MAG: right-handed parallel beta-helix repeat-containing protein, partial [Clostridia bacterium]|nr:right-handed parallel beta-helix repeat-containing protein [Clostridia bacterium]